MRIFALVLIICALCLPVAYTNVETADAVFKNGNISTVSERNQRAEAIAVKAGKIIFVGSNKDAKAFEGKATRVIDLKGQTVVPGMTDSHYHLSGVGAREMNLNLEGITSLEEFVAKVKERVDRA